MFGDRDRLENLCQEMSELEDYVKDLEEERSHYRYILNQIEIAANHNDLESIKSWIKGWDE